MNSSYLLGYDIGSSSIKATLLHAESGEVKASSTYPKKEMHIRAPRPGWAEQDPEQWWENVKKATKELLSSTGIGAEQVEAIGISYQMHGLVLVDRNQQLLRPAIIWCDSRAVEVGNKAFNSLGATYCLSNMLNSPGNFTAAKLRWVQEHEPGLYQKVHKAMLPGEYIAMKLSGEIQTTLSGLSEGIYWNFREGRIAHELLQKWGIDPDLLPEVVPTFSHQASVHARAAEETGLKRGTKITYRAGDQPNNAFSLNVLRSGEVAATAGTSGVVYGILEQPAYDPKSRVNTFIHVNHQPGDEKYGVLLCVNGTGILNSWLRATLGQGTLRYEEMNRLAAQAPVGSDGLVFLPFGNGAERILENKALGAQLHHLNFNRHSSSHLLRAGQEGIASALAYGFGIMKEMGMQLKSVKAGYANMFLSPVFCQAFASMSGVVVELYNTDGSQGAARAAGVGARLYASFDEAFQGLKKVEEVAPDRSLQAAYQDAYGHWLQTLEKNF